MKKEEKTKITREKIIDAAIAEFGLQSYDVASINTICLENKISKGLIYHNFKNKDELYLTCVTKCYEEMMKSMNDYDGNSISVKTNIENLLKRRQVFFDEFPFFKQIFFNSVLMPPKHLVVDLKKIKQDHDQYIKEQYKQIVAQLNLKEGVSIEKAVSYLMTFQEMYNGYFREMYHENMDIDQVIETHETKLSELLDIMLYGIAHKSKDI